MYDKELGDKQENKEDKTFPLDKRKNKMKRNKDYFVLIDIDIRHLTSMAALNEIHKLITEANQTQAVKATLSVDWFACKCCGTENIDSKFRLEIQLGEERYTNIVRKTLWSIVGELGKFIREV